MVLARPERFELPTSWFVARRSIQLSYGRDGQAPDSLVIRTGGANRTISARESYSAALFLIHR